MHRSLKRHLKRALGMREKRTEYGRKERAYLAVFRRFPVAESGRHDHDQSLVLQIDDVVIRHAHHLKRERSTRSTMPSREKMKANLGVESVVEQLG